MKNRRVSPCWQNDRPVRHSIPGTLRLMLLILAMGGYMTWQPCGYTEEGITNIIDGFSTNISGTVTVGDSGCHNALIITNGGTLTCTEARIGNASTAYENLALVIGMGSAWYQTDRLWVGYAGVSNRLIVAGGALVTNNYCTIRTRNVLMVTDPGSRFICSGLGMEGGCLNAINSATLETWGVTGSAICDNVEALVAGHGTRWLNRGNFKLGHLSNSNVWQVLDGAVITNGGNVYIGSADFLDGHYCSVTLAGPGTRWVAAGDLYIGEDGSFNTLVVSNGAWMENNTGFLGAWGPRNSAIVTGQDSTWVNHSDLYVGKGGRDCFLFITNGATVSNATGYIGWAGSAQSNLVLVIGSGARWINASNLYVGYDGSGNLLAVRHGARVECFQCHVGYGPYSMLNSLVVDGPGSALACGGALTVGNWYMENSLIVTNGASVSCGDVYIGAGADPDIPMYNRAEITGAGAKLESRGGIYVGSLASTFNELVVGSGGAVTSQRLVIGVDPYSDGNCLVINGGSLGITNVAGQGYLDVRYGWMYLWDGSVLTDLLLCTNGGLTFHGGQLATRGAWFTKHPVVVGNGLRQARFLAREGLYVFGHGLILTNNAELAGAGAFFGNITNAGVIRPGSPIGTITVSGTVTLLPGSVIELDVGGTQTNQYDRMLISGRLSANGTLTVRLVDGFRPQPGDSFRLLGFGSAEGAFTSITLPAGYLWENRLLIDGTISVTGLCQVQFDPPQRQGTNLVLTGAGGPPGARYFLLTSTNITVPLANWTVIATNNFETNGRFSLIIPIDPAVHRRFFTIAY